MAARAAGLDVALLDEGPEAGGQVWRAPRTPAARDRSGQDGDGRAGADLRRALAASGVRHLCGALVWFVAPPEDAGGAFEVTFSNGQDSRSLRAPRLLAAPGARERVVPFPGWTLPGVLGLAAATALIKREGVLPGRRVVIAGQGPLLIAVAAKALTLGLRPAAVVDLASRGEWLAAAAGLASLPRPFLQGAGWLARLMRARVPILHRHAVVAAHGDDRLREIVVAAVDAQGRPRPGRRQGIPADTLYVGNGLQPNTEISRLLGVLHDRDPLRGGLVPRTDDWGRTSRAGFYVAGDGAGIRGALPAVLSGRLAGLAAAADAGRLDAHNLLQRSAGLLRRRRRLSRLADVSCRLMALREGQLQGLAEETVICRCEDVTLGDLRRAIAAGAGDLNQLKHFTRLGMGPCQARMCGANAAALVAAETGQAPDAPSMLTPRPPLRPVSIAEMAGAFSYDDIPVPAPAPL
ncbi:MAG: NAD(P)/FAD-dependent oxidoreductase [Roseovarius sp.]